MQETIACLIYCTIVVFIPLKQTYLSMKANNDQTNLSLWANYWALFSIITFIQSYLGFLTYQPFKFIFMIFFLWCYHSDYKGALFINQNLRKIITSNPAITDIFKMIQQKAKFLNLFESQSTFSQIKQKTN